MLSSAHLHSDEIIAQYKTRDVVIVGRIDGEPQLKKDSLRVKIGDIYLNYSISASKSQVYASVDKASDVRAGDIVAISGKLSGGFGDFAATIWQAKLLSVKRNNLQSPFA